MLPEIPVKVQAIKFSFFPLSSTEDNNISIQNINTVNSVVFLPSNVNVEDKIVPFLTE